MNKYRTAARDIAALLHPFPHALAWQDPMHRETRARNLLASSALYEQPSNAAALLSASPARARAAFPMVNALLRPDDVVRPPPLNPMHRETAPSRPGPLRNGNPRGNPNAAPRCGAKTRAGCPCKSPAMRNGRCRMHGGASTGPRTPEGRARVAAARTIHGRYSAATKGFFRHIREIERRSKALLALVGDGLGPVDLGALAHLLPPPAPQHPIHREKPASLLRPRVTDSVTLSPDHGLSLDQRFHKRCQSPRSRCRSTKAKAATARSQTGSTNATDPPPRGSP